MGSTRKDARHDCLFNGMRPLGEKMGGDTARRAGAGVTIKLSGNVREEERDGDVASTVDAASRRVPDLAGLRTA
jgi:hypothetical protein